MHNFSELLSITLHVSDGLSVHHQECKTYIYLKLYIRLALLMLDGETVRNM